MTLPICRRAASISRLHALISQTFILFGLFLALISPLVAQTPADSSIFQMQHTVWRARDGAPVSINTMAQAADGMLLIGSRHGLYRFDGLHFDRVDAVDKDRYTPADIYSLLPMPNGDLWIGLSGGEAVFLHNGQATRYREGIPHGGINNFIIGKDGVLWAVTTQGLARFEQGHFVVAAENWGLPARMSMLGIQDREGNLWIRTFVPGLFRLKPGTHRFEHLPGEASGFLPFAMAPDGRIWESGPGGVTLANELDLPRSAPHHWGLKRDFSFAPPDIRFDANGDLWATLRGSGVMRVPAANFRRADAGIGVLPVETYLEKDGLSSDLIMTSFVDHENNLWIGTERGLDRFHRGPAKQVHLGLDGMYFGVQPTNDGGFWLGAFSGGVWRVKPDGVREVTAVPKTENKITALLSANDGGLWLAATSGVSHLKDNHWAVVPFPADFEKQSIVGLCEDKSGNLYTASGRGGVRRWDGHAWTKDAQLSRTPVTLFATDPTGAVWAGATDGTVTVRSGTSLQTIDSKSGLSIGPITAIYSDGTTAWIGGDRGLARWDGHRATTVSVSDGPSMFYRVTAILPTRNGDLWLSTGNGVVHLLHSELQAAAAHPAHTVASQWFDFSDGIDGAPLRQFLLPTGTETADGRLLFTTGLGVYEIDPASLAVRPPPPIAAVASVIADGVQISGSDIPPRPHELQINYGAVSLSNVERLLFRYRLEGTDRTWQSAGTRRQAFYTNLPPGDYTFRLATSYGDGIWTEMPSPIRLTVQPAVTQRVWFRVAIVLLVVALAWFLLRLRVRRTFQAMQSRMAERMHERERIARDLHDTLLQAFQGVILSFDSVTHSLPDDAERAKLLSVLDSAERVLADGRNRIKDLRITSDKPEALVEGLCELGEELASVYNSRFRCDVTGKPLAIRRYVNEELTMIGREAIRNAFSHANPTEVRVEAGYERDELRILIRDDGKGIPEEILNEGGKPGHWGLSGMQERAEKIGSRLVITSEKSAGTSVAIHVPARIAYGENIHEGWFARLFTHCKRLLRLTSLSGLESS